MTRSLTVSSGSATPKSECIICAIQGLSGEGRTDRTGVRTIPNSEILAAPSRKALQTLAGGPGRSSAATTSQSTSSAGATAAVPITVGRDSRTSIQVGKYAIFQKYPALKCLYLNRGGNGSAVK